MDAVLEKRIKRQIIGKPHRFMAVAPLGFEETLTQELNYIGVETASDRDHASDCGHAESIKVSGDGKVEFIAKLTEAWKAVAYSRIANRVLMEIGNFKAENFGQLEKGTAGIPWELYLDERPEIARGPVAKRGIDFLGLHVTCKHSRLYHSGAIEERVRPIIEKALAKNTANNCSAAKECSATKNRSDAKESAVENDCLQNIYIHLQDDRCTVWLDLAGEELYKRGHDRYVAEAPLKETIAAAMIFEAQKLTTDHQPLTTIIDPMAGSGTFSLEAAYIANGLIPGKCRDFALKHQPAFKEATWNFILRQKEIATSEADRVQPLTIITSDISDRALGIIRHNVESCPLSPPVQRGLPSSVPAGGVPTIVPQKKDFFSYTADELCPTAPQPRHTLLLLNPPYGKRLDFDAPRLYADIGHKLNAWILDLQNRDNKRQFSQISATSSLTVAILAPKGKCTENLLHKCPQLAAHLGFSPKAPLKPRQSGHFPIAWRRTCIKCIETSHGGFSLNAIFVHWTNDGEIQ